MTLLSSTGRSSTIIKSDPSAGSPSQGLSSLAPPLFILLCRRSSNPGWSSSCPPLAEANASSGIMGCASVKSSVPSATSGAASSSVSVEGASSFFFARASAARAAAAIISALVLRRRLGATAASSPDVGADALSPSCGKASGVDAGLAGSSSGVEAKLSSNCLRASNSALLGRPRFLLGASTTGSVVSISSFSIIFC